jgi:class 3 adenylate cyclase
MLNAYFEVAIPPIVREYGGQIDRLIGDALMATWGTGETSPTMPSAPSARRRRSKPRRRASPTGIPTGLGSGSP